MDLRGLLKAFLILFAALSVGDALAQSDELGALNARIEDLYQARKFSEALPLAQRAVVVAEQLNGVDDPAVASALDKLVMIYNGLNRSDETEPYIERALKI